MGIESFIQKILVAKLPQDKAMVGCEYGKFNMVCYNACMQIEGKEIVTVLEFLVVCRNIQVGGNVQGRMPWMNYGAVLNVHGQPK